MTNFKASDQWYWRFIKKYEKKEAASINQRTSPQVYEIISSSSESSQKGKHSNSVKSDEINLELEVKCVIPEAFRESEKLTTREIITEAKNQFPSVSIKDIALFFRELSKTQKENPEYTVADYEKIWKKCYILQSKEKKRKNF